MSEYVTTVDGLPFDTQQDPTIDYLEWKCLCGNESHLDGFYPVVELVGIGNRSMGYMQTHPTHAGNEPMGWKDLFVCGQCMRVFHETNGEVVGYMDRRDFDAGM